MSEIKPEARIANLEKLTVNLGGRIEELSSDTAEELKAIRQDIKDLDKGMIASFKQIGEHFGLIEKENATKADLTALETRVNARFEKLEQEVQGIRREHGQMLKEILERLPK